MEKIVSTITVLYDKYRNNPKTLEKLNYYITKELPINIEVYHNKEQNRIILEKQIDMYINTFLNSSQNQYFYIEKTDTFISYDGLDFKIINEDEIWYNILSEISNNNNLIDCKEKILKKMISQIKHNDIFCSMPESNTIQNLIHLIVPNLFETKTEAKYFFLIIGDNILKKNKQLIHYCNESSRVFLDLLDQFVVDYFGSDIQIKNTIRFRYNEAHEYKNCRILKLKPSFTKNRDLCDLIVKKHLFNLISISCHYSKRYHSSDKYIKNSASNHLLERICYLENLTSEKIINDFSVKMLDSKTGCNITKRDMFFLWQKFLKQLSLPNILYKNSFFKLMEEKYQFEGNYKNLYSKYLANLEHFRNFWKSTIHCGENELQDEFEISEILFLYNFWCEKNCKEAKNLVSEKDIFFIVNYYYNNVNINKNILTNITCSLWKKREDIGNAFQDKFNKQITHKISLRNAYTYYCDYVNETGMNFIASKQYFEKYIDRIVPQQYIVNNYIELEFWN